MFSLSFMQRRSPHISDNVDPSIALRMAMPLKTQALVPFDAGAKERWLQEELRQGTRDIASKAKAIQPKPTQKKYGAAKKEWTISYSTIRMSTSAANLAVDLV